MKDLPSGYSVVRLLLLVERSGTLEFEAPMRLTTLAPMIPVNKTTDAGVSSRHKHGYSAWQSPNLPHESHGQSLSPLGRCARASNTLQTWRDR